MNCTSGQTPTFSRQFLFDRHLTIANLFHAQGLSRGAISRKIGVSVPTVSRHLARYDRSVGRYGMREYHRALVAGYRKGLEGEA